MKNYKYNTPLEVANLLMKLIPDYTFNSVIDICCGSWNLLQAAKFRYPHAVITGVDIDAASARTCIKDALFFQCDGREFALEAYKEKRSYDLILSNPPFGYLCEKDIVIGQGGVIHVNNFDSNRYENEMFKANILLAHEKSVFLFILPSTVVEGEIYKKARVSIAKDYIVHNIIKLPLNTFGKGKISTYALIIEKNCGEINYQTKYINLEYCNDKYSLGETYQITHDKMMNGEWNIWEKVHRTKVEVQSFRGNISSNHLTRSGYKVLHCSNMIKDGKWVPSVRYCDKNNQLVHCVRSLPGDVIVNRIGKYAGYWCINEEEVFISDCLIAFRAKKKEELWERFYQETINGRLNIPLKGVATRYISKTDIIEIL